MHASDAIANRLGAFLKRREAQGGDQTGAVEIAKCVVQFTAQHNAWLAEKLLDIADAAGDYDIINFVTYEQQVRKMDI